MRILMIGDVVGQLGCDYLRQEMPGLKSEYKPDVVVVNGENSAQGNGIMPASAEFLLDSGANVVTTGNHAMRRHQIYEYFEGATQVIRPLNLHRTAPGKGMCIHDDPRCPVAVVSLLGRAFMDPAENPFDAMDALLETLGTPCVLVDFHAEATAEKQSLGYYLDGRVSAVIGTHTHVQTNDARILPKGTAFMCDVGMCGGYNSVIGVAPEQPIHKMRTGMPAHFAYLPGNEEFHLNGVIIDINSDGRATDIKPISRRGRIG